MTTPDTEQRHESGRKAPRDDHRPVPSPPLPAGRNLETRVLELIASGALLPAVLDAVTQALQGLIPGSRCSVLLLDPATRTLAVRSTPGHGTTVEIRLPGATSSGSQ